MSSTTAASHFPRWEPYLRLFGIPFLALIAYQLTRIAGCPPLIGYFISLVYTLTFWQGLYYVVARTRHRYPGLDHTAKRVQVIALGGVLFILAGVPLIHLMTVALLPDKPFSLDLISQGYLVTTVLSSMVLGLYEAVYYLRLGREAADQAGLAREEALAAQIIILKNQINPHFLFNNFNTLAGVIEEDPALAGRMVEELARFYRHVLAADEQPFYTLTQELECLSAYRFLLGVRHAESVELHIDIPQRMLSRTLPPMTLQMLVENAVKHNAVSAEQPLVIHIRVEGDRLRVCNSLAPRQKAMPGTGLGLANLTSRFQLLGMGRVEVVQDAQLFCVTLPLGAEQHGIHAKGATLVSAATV